MLHEPRNNPSQTFKTTHTQYNVDLITGGARGRFMGTRNAEAALYRKEL